MPTPRQYESQADRQRAYRERQKQARLDELATKNLPATPAIPTMPGTARWTALQAQARAALEAIQDEMQAYFDDRSETWQEGDRGNTMQEHIEQVSGLLNDMDTLELT